ncbi:MAG: glycoside hydrolase family 3 N-terminal domain-containing protein, partial [Pseudomonadales bacterium]
MQQDQIEERLSQMTLAQKIGQITMAERMHVTPEDVKTYALGAVLSGGGSHPGDNGPSDWVQMNDEFWQAAVADPDSQGIPILFGIDAVHGHNNLRCATIFPHNIGFGAAGDPKLVAQMASITAKEILATGLEWSFAPTLAVVQDCHWGRSYESYGTDPKQVGAMGEAYVKALQAEGVMGCAKHWVGDGGTRHGVDQGETTLPWEDLEATHVAPYYPALAAGVMSVMISFNSWNGAKCHGHRFLVTEYLKGQLGFAGIVVSDWDGVDYLHKDYGAAVAQAVNAGLDMFMVPERWREFIATLTEQVEQGNVPQARIDDAVRRVLLAKIRCGLFTLPRPSERVGANAASFGSAAHREVAREAVRRSQVLLKNDGVLPIDASATVLVAGKTADNLGLQCGGWTVSWQGQTDGTGIAGTSIWQGIKSLVPSAELSQDGSGADAARHDVAIVVVGETPYAEGQGDIRASDAVLQETAAAIEGSMSPLEAYASSMKLADIHPEDLACIRRVSAAGVPVVVVLVSGRPL